MTWREGEGGGGDDVAGFEWMGRYLGEDLVDEVCYTCVVLIIGGICMEIVVVLNVFTLLDFGHLNIGILIKLL